ncbi:MAG: aminoacyl-tRNA hydrolase [Rhodospirillales bacterium]|nr:aminoacyl-tRNA hydrolase [Rhodospirillales bacterium]
MWLLAGLGNPGDKYAGNRHNVGFMAVDGIADEYGFPAFRSKFQGQMAEGVIAGHKVVILKPQTYMNNSGQSVAAAAKFYKIPPARIIVFHDELDLPNGKMKVKKGGGAAGHNGLKSIDSHLNNKDYWRIRLGIGHPGDREKVHGYVLGDFSKTDRAGINELLAAVVGFIPLMLDEKDSDFMSRVALQTKEG